MTTEENNIFDSFSSKIDLLMKILNFYLGENANDEDSSTKDTKELFSLTLAKNLFAFVDIRKIDLKKDQIMAIISTPKVQIILDPFAVLLQQLSDGVFIIEEAQKIAKMVTPFLGEDIKGQGIETQSQMEASLMILMNVTLSEEFHFERMLQWLLAALAPFVSNPEFIETLQELFQNLNGRMKCRLSKYQEVPRTPPLPGAGNGGVIERPKAKTLPWQKIDDINKGYACIFRQTFLLSLILYVRKVKRAENPDIIE